HRTTAQWMRREHLMQILVRRRIDKFRVQRLSNRLPDVPDAIEILPRLLLRPVAVQQVALQKQTPIRKVAAHRNHRKRDQCSVRRSKQVRDLSTKVRIVVQTSAVLEPHLQKLQSPHDSAGQTSQFRYPTE